MSIPSALPQHNMACCATPVALQSTPGPFRLLCMQLYRDSSRKSCVASYFALKPVVMMFTSSTFMTLFAFTGQCSSRLSRNCQHNTSAGLGPACNSRRAQSQPAGLASCRRPSAHHLTAGSSKHSAIRRNPPTTPLTCNTRHPSSRPHSGTPHWPARSARPCKRRRLYSSGQPGSRPSTAGSCLSLAVG